MKTNIMRTRGPAWTALATLLTVLALRRILIRVTVGGDSMVPGLSDGDRALFLRWWPSLPIRHGMIVVGDLETLLGGAPSFEFPPPSRSDSGTELFVKRLIGPPGATVTLELKELSHAVQAALRDRADGAGNLVWDVPQHQCFVKGDNPGSADSALAGPIPLTAIKGVKLFTLPRIGDRAESRAELGHWP